MPDWKNETAARDGIKAPVRAYHEQFHAPKRELVPGDCVNYAGRVCGALEQTDFVMNNSFRVGVSPAMTDGMIDDMAQSIPEAVSG